MPRSRTLSRGFNRGQSQRRLTAWVLGPGGSALSDLDAVEITTNGTSVLGAGVASLIPNVTVVRIHGFIELALTASPLKLDGFSWAAGIGVVNFDAFTDIGPTAMPDPFGDIDWPGWMWHASGSIRTTDLTAAGSPDPTSNPVLIPIETKSMRKLRQKEILALMFQSGVTGVSTMTVRSMTRILLKLP